MLRWASNVDSIIASVGVPHNLSRSDFSAVINSVIQQESGGDPSAVGAQGEIGLMQIKPSTAGISADLLLDPFTNLRAGVRYLKQQINSFGLHDGLAAYNAGPGGRNFPAAQRYADEVMARASLETVSTTPAFDFFDLISSSSENDLLIESPRENSALAEDDSSPILASTNYVLIFGIILAGIFLVR